MAHVEMFGCPFDRVNLHEAVAQVEGFIERGDRLYQSVGVNTDQLLKMQRDPSFAESVRRADQITADGQPVVWMSRLFGEPLPARIPSIDLMEALLPRAAERGWGVFLLGARPEAVREAARTFQERWPGLQVAGARDGYFTAEDELEVVEQINASGASILLIAISSPKKERFVEGHREALRVPFVLGVGGAFDIAAGRTHRAPAWMRQRGLEWVWRMWQEPRRMTPRVLDDLAFTPHVAREALRRWSLWR